MHCAANVLANTPPPTRIPAAPRVPMLRPIRLAGWLHRKCRPGEVETDQGGKHQLIIRRAAGTSPAGRDGRGDTGLTAAPGGGGLCRTNLKGVCKPPAALSVVRVGPCPGAPRVRAELASNITTFSTFENLN